MPFTFEMDTGNDVLAIDIAVSDVLRAQSRLVKFVGGEAGVRQKQTL